MGGGGKELCYLVLSNLFGGGEGVVLFRVMMGGGGKELCYLVLLWGGGG